MAALHNIEPQEVGRFSIDEKNRLLWDGHVLQTESVVVLTGKQSFWVILGVIAAVLGAIASLTYTGTYVWVTFFKPTAAVQQRESPPASNPASPPAVLAPEKSTSRPAAPPAGLGGIRKGADALLVSG